MIKELHNKPLLHGRLILVWLLGMWLIAIGCQTAPVGPPAAKPCLSDLDCLTGTCQSGVCSNQGSSKHREDHQEGTATAEPNGEPPSLTDQEPPSEPVDTRDGGEPVTDQTPELPPESTPEPAPPCDKVNETRECYTGPAGTAGKGPCQKGQQICQANKTWSECFGQELPQVESCNGKDDNCDGQIDETFVNLGQACKDQSQQGACQQGTITSCQNGKEICTSNTKPSAQEICDNQIDDDCNGKVDESPPCTCQNGATRPCGNDQGVCKQGTQTCTGGQWSECIGETKPAPIELCDGLDNDCDGQTDETFTNLGQPCTAGQGACQAKGTFQCAPDKGSTECSAKAGTASAELCDGIDNDCDGKVDEGFEKLGTSCTAGQGACQSTGKFICSNDKKQLACDATPGTPSQEQCNGKDDDCDGKTDEDYTGNNQLSRSCYTGPANTANKGICKNGVQFCVGGVFETSCKGQVLPEKETCDRRDEDCDGVPDNGCQCSDGQTRPCGSSTGSCKQGTQACSGGKWGPCLGQTGATTEKCDGQDNDCDGQIDETFTNKGQSCSSGQGICEKKGTFVCSNDQTKTVCNAQPGNPQQEVCNGKDDNCNGIIDDNPTNLGQDCKSNTPGICQAGRYVCKNGQRVCESKVVPGAIKERCRDNQDNDCDGKTDEICGHQYNYALVSTSGNFVSYNGTNKQRGFSSIRRRSFGHYELNPTTNGLKCGSVPLFTTPYGSFIRPISWRCRGDGYDIFTGPEHKGSASINTRQDANFYVAQPNPSTDTYAVVTACPTSTCTLGSKKGTISVTTTTTLGRWRIDSPECANAWRPIFVSIKDGTPDTFATAYRSGSGGHCFVELYNKSGLGTLFKSFAVWFPSTSQAAVASIQAASGAPVLRSKNDFGQSTSPWQTFYKQYSGTSDCLTSGNCYRTGVLFDGFASPSGVIVTPRVSGFSGASFFWSSGSNQSVTTSDNNTGRIRVQNFNIIFIQ